MHTTTESVEWDRLLAEIGEGRMERAGALPRVDGKALDAAIVDGGLFGHLHEDHEPEIRDWLARGG